MKWLLLTLLSINLILFIVNVKDQKNTVYVYEKIEGISEIKLLSEVSSHVNLQDERCYVIEGFSSEEQLEKAKMYLRSRSVTFQLVSREQELASVFWVYVQQGDERSVKDILKKQGIDSYVISEGELRGKLSAGLFENIDLARALVKRLKKLNIEAEIFERKKQKNNISMQLKSTQIKDKAMLMKGFEEQGIIIAEIKEFFCKGIASEK